MKDHGYFMQKKLLILLPLFILLSLINTAFSEQLSDSQKEAIKKHKAEQLNKEKTINEAIKHSAIRVYPDIVTNLAFDPENKKKLHYILLQLDVIPTDDKFSEFLEKNQPIYTDKIILFLNKRSHNSFNTPKQKEALVQQLRSLINQALYDELQTNVVENIIIQKIIIE